jgi:hypothetical protein
LPQGQGHSHVRGKPYEGAASGALPLYKVLKLINDKFLVADCAFHQITDRDYSNQLSLIDDWKMANSPIGHNCHTFLNGPIGRGV